MKFSLFYDTSLNNKDILLHIKEIKNDIINKKGMNDENKESDREEVLSKNR